MHVHSVFSLISKKKIVSPYSENQCVLSQTATVNIKNAFSVSCFFFCVTLSEVVRLFNVFVLTVLLIKLIGCSM